MTGAKVQRFGGERMLLQYW